MGKPESPVLLKKRADLDDNTGQSGGAQIEHLIEMGLDAEA